MPPKRKIVFDPDTAKTNAKRKKVQQDTIREIRESALAFFGVVQKYESAVLLSGECDAATLELFLVAKIGLNGACLVNLACKVVPENHPNRFEALASLVNFALSKDVGSGAAKNLVNIVDKSSLSKERDSDILSRYMMTTGQPVTFFTPPVSTCINSACSLCGVQNSLSAHHGEAMVTVYTLEGPRPGLKQALKCRSCSCIYNYSKYGWKRSEGERYYNIERDYIEVTDIALCSRKFHNMFCYLK